MFCSSAAFAADLPVQPPVYVPPAFTWTGFYFGDNLGFGGDRFVYPFSAAAVDGSAGFGGSVSITSGGGTVNATGGIGGGPFGASGEIGSTINYIGTVRARAGYAWDRFLVYGTGGFAYGQVTSSASVTVAAGGGGGSITGSETSGRVGWTVGGGFEYAITPNFTVKTEYLYVNLGTPTAFDQIFWVLLGSTSVRRRPRILFGLA